MCEIHIHRFYFLEVNIQQAAYANPDLPKQ
jgi:hypothetical protein